MKDLVTAIFVFFICLIGLIAAGLAINAWYDPEGADHNSFAFFAIMTVFSFLIGWLLWKPSR